MGDFENKKDDLVGKAKEAAGNATDNEDLANEGKADQVISQAKDKVSDAVEGKGQGQRGYWRPEGQVNPAGFCAARFNT